MNRRVGSSPDYARRLATIEALKLVAAALQTLTARERAFLNMHFGLGDGIARSREEIARCLGVTIMHVRGLESRTISKLRHPSRGVALQTALELLLDSSMQVPAAVRAELFGVVSEVKTTRIFCDKHGWSVQPATLISRCASCPCEIFPSGKGRPPRYCSVACKQSSYRERDRSRQTLPDAG